MGHKTPARGPSNGAFPFNPSLPPAHLIGQRPEPQPTLAMELTSLPKPTWDHILVERKYIGVSKDSKIVIPQNLIEKETSATVIDVGPGRPTENGSIMMPCCKVGDRVLAEPGKGVPLNVSGRSIFLIPNIAVWAVYPPEEEKAEATDVELKLEESPPATL